MVLSENWQVAALLFSSNGFFATRGSSKQKIARLKIRTNHTRTRCTQFMKNDFLQDLFNKSTDHPIVTIDNNKYTNHLLGISFYIPKNWNIVSIQKFNKEARKQIFNDPYEGLKPDVFELFDSPIIVMTKLDSNDDKYDGIVSPTINFSIIAKENEYKEMSLYDYANEIDIDENKKLLKRFSIIKKGRIFQKNGFDYIKFDTEYLFEHPELENGIMVEFSILNIDFKDFFLDFSMTQCKIQNQNAEKEFRSFIESIKLI
ncbi:hypothetical protein [Psychroserpens sp. S379A]|uniref:hypothetical protein n=1 Tax=Psychroserpens sp. S379A TaxID=3415137 RepID=UPI003C7B658F